jgi:hypothetical protein
MGIPVPGGTVDSATRSVTGALASVTSGLPAVFLRNFNVSLWGVFVATLVAERSFDGGTNWLPLTFSDGTGVGPFTGPASGTWAEPEDGVLYRIRCSAYTSGTINYRLSQ